MAGLFLVAEHRPYLSRDEAPDAVAALLALLLEGVETPRLGGAEAVAWASELANALADLACNARVRSTVRLGLGAQAWEMGLERTGPCVLVSLFHGGSVPEVVLFERRIDGDLIVAHALAALAHPLAARDLSAICARDRLVSAPSFSAALEERDVDLVAIESPGDAPFALSAEVLFRRSATPIGPAPSVSRADLLPLLFRGRLRISTLDQGREAGDVFVFLVAEQLAAMAEGAADAWARARPYYRRLVVGQAVLGVRLGSLGAASLTIGTQRRPGDARAQTWTFPAVDVATLVRAVVAFGRALAQSIVRRDRAQNQNLRLTTFRAKIRELSDRLRDATRNDAKVNDSPESYRAFAASVRPDAPQTDAFARSRLCFTPRWMAAVPSIDLRATFLCGDLLVIGSAREVSCLDGKTGVVIWKRPVGRAVAVMTSLGLARLSPDGELVLHELSTGEARWSTRIAPRVGASASGAVVGVPGLPKMLIVSEGQRHLAAVDLHSGEVRWRYAARRGSAFRLRRAGKLVVVASGEHSLVALDVLTGEIVWRFCDRLRFASSVSVDNDSLFALAGDGAFVARGGTRLHHLDPWSGAARWSADLPPNVASVGTPLLGPETVVIATHGRRGTALVGFDRKTGEQRFDLIVSSSAASCMAVDDTILVNTEGGELVALDANDGATRYRHVFPSATEGDRPRRLEPVLRSGALFVPQTEVHVLRPLDGTVLGRVPGDIIPDLLRVDERCDVYVAEESGHLAAYASGPRLTLVGQGT